jgi:hypothetical protein
MNGFDKLQKALAYVFDVAYLCYPEESAEAKELINFANKAVYDADWQEDNDGQIVIYTGVDS